MDKHISAIIEKKISRVMESLKKNNMEAYYVETKEQVVDRVRELTRDGDTVACGGSQTLFETGVIEHLRSGRYRFFDRHAPGLTRDQILEVHRHAFSCDAYLTGTNAVTEKGELYNVDGTGNRVAAMMFGPKNVIVVAGYNKIVKNVDEAAERVRRVAGPANCTRLRCGTPCVQSGFCQDCSSQGRICNDYAIINNQIPRGRIKVILVGEELGY